MGIFTLGGGAGDPPFNRTFFNVTLGDLIERQKGENRLTLFLTDGSTLDVCSIDELTEQYVALRSYANGEDACSVSVQLVPYALIYRVEITPRGENANRVGFHWTAPGKRHTGRRSPR
ncbi:MAG TPA: hypothetical protein VF950_29170 [Planctomycetota bacterium]